MTLKAHKADRRHGAPTHGRVATRDALRRIAELDQQVTLLGRHLEHLEQERLGTQAALDKRRSERAQIVAELNLKHGD